MSYKQLQISTGDELTIEEVGGYGMKWANWMEDNHKKLVREMKKNKTFAAVAKSTNEYARSYRELLNRQYEQLHPRPYEFEGEEALQAWKFTRDFYTDSEVMRERVLHPYT
jgi:uncharacterized iron-regulated protein